MALHELALERRTLHGHFSRELEPVLQLDSGESFAFATLDAGWGLEPPHADGTERERFEPLVPELDSGHALIGPVAVRGARAGQVLEVGIDSVRVGPVFNPATGEQQAEVLLAEQTQDLATGRIAQRIERIGVRGHGSPSVTVRLP